MKHIVKILLLSISSVVMFTSCEDIFEIRLDETTVNIIMPADGLVTPRATQTFWWDATYGATSYRIQIVSPSFDSVYTLFTDQIIDTNYFQFTLDPGSYQWRLKAINSATETPWAVRNLVIDSTLDLTGQNIILLKPAQNDTANVINMTFTWQDLYNAESYTFELWQPNTNGTLVNSQSISVAEVQATLASEGDYEWRVKATNALSSTTFTSRLGYLDTAKPASPTLVNPSPNAILSNKNVTFSWLRPSSSGSSIHDSLILASDTNFIQLYQIYTTKNTTLTDSLLSGSYFLRLYSIDKAGNQSKSSTIRKFTVM